MRKVLIDCGGNLGQGYEDLKRRLNINNNWDVYIFEPNKRCYDILVEKYNDENIKIINKAVFIYDGEINFYIPKNDEYSVGSTIHKNFHNSVVDNLYDEYVVVESVNLSKFIDKIIDKEIYLKLDVEGSEYDIIEMMINDETINKIEKVFVEFHNEYASTELNEKYNLDNRKNNIIEYFNSNNIKHEIWY